MSVFRRVSSPLFTTQPVAPDYRAPPVVVVGLARSGSTFLSHVMSALDDWYIFDDVYLHREARALRASGPLDQAQLKSLVDFLGWQVRARIKFEQHFSKPQLELEAVDRFCEALMETFANRRIQWHELLEEWLVRLALHHGCRRWGYKVPQDFLHMGMLSEHFPGVRFVFVIRDPRKTMSSFKYVDGEDGTPGQYHPWVYARYWRMASRVVKQEEKDLGLPVLRVRFEDLVENPRGEADRLATFLGTTVEQEVQIERGNSSFSGSARKELTETERFICEWVASEEMATHGYSLSGARPRVADVRDLVRVTGRFAGYQATRLWKDRAARISVGSFLQRLGHE